MKLNIKTKLGATADCSWWASLQDFQTPEGHMQAITPWETVEI